MLTNFDLMKLGNSGITIPSYSSDQLRKIRGALFTARAKVEWGPRPDSPDNIFMWGSQVAGAYSQESDKLIYESIKNNGYTHIPVGPFIDAGYHDQVPPVDFRLDQRPIINRLIQVYQAGLIPVFFIKTDNWTLDQLKELEPIYKQKIWQDLVKMHVIMGWEPSMDTPNADYVAFLQYGRYLFPNSLSYLHMPANFDAPGNNEDLTPGTPNYIGNAGCWCNVAPLLHGFLGQYGPFGKRPGDDPNTANEFVKLFKYNRFKSGYAGWPTYSAWGSSTPLDYGYAEGCSYTAWNENFPQEYCKEWGNLALDSGADFVFDGLDMVKK